MIEAVVVMNTQGKPRLTKFYDYVPMEKQQEILRSIYGVSCPSLIITVVTVRREESEGGRDRYWICVTL
ncbi:hypothetical protein C5167_050752 [Papaver somniferum]|uniref:AP complex mu/sigma subunit domain-containing protein n=1 Tax=Papaver somniferum TaxID=3469 RepID=A0A4Y7KSD5_PAPSO|nr:hypothetical protein C5167_050752 [Papaver somniferum]